MASAVYAGGGRRTGIGEVTPLPIGKTPSPPAPGPDRSPGPDPVLSPIPPLPCVPAGSAVVATLGAGAAGVGSGSGAIVSGSVTIGAGGGVVTAGDGIGGGGVGFGGAPPPPRAAGRGSGIQTRFGSSSRVTRGAGCSRRCEARNSSATMTAACAATDTANAGVRWRGWRSTQSFDARRGSSA